MESSSSSLGSKSNSPETASIASTDHGLSVLSTLLTALEEPSQSPVPPTGNPSESESPNQLIQVRLGMASSLYVALQAKHAPTAQHCLRVALGCSSWSLGLKLSDQQRDEIEVAALLHDIGKIGVPDHVLLKPGKLTVEEAKLIDRYRLIGKQILLSCCASQGVLEIVKYAAAWYNGSKLGFDRQGESLPLGARMVSILDAYDSMTTNQVYRQAVSRERATAELFEFAGTQFDPALVEQYCDLLATDEIRLSPKMARRWLHELTPDASNNLWKRSTSVATPEPDVIKQLFHQRLLDSMHDGILFVDPRLRILLWNRAAERLTGLGSEAVLHRKWESSLIGLQDEHGTEISAENCPIAHTLRTGIQTFRRLTIASRSRGRLSVDTHVLPVIGHDGALYGATLLLHDASSQISLELRVQALHEKAIRDPLTKVANRAEFDRVHVEFVQTHLERRLPYSLIMCDIDHFKRVNDTFGHQAGDDALVSFATLLQQTCEPGDLVSRYGGEEFVMLCADCNNATATERADSIRAQLEKLRHESLGGQSITASFGVTEIQAGDNPETMLRRADRALMQAKENGRNQVVQLGSGIAHHGTPDTHDRQAHGASKAKSQLSVTATLETTVPRPVAIAKLKGFISDHHGDILSESGSKFLLHIATRQTHRGRRGSDRAIGFRMALQFVEQANDPNRQTGPTTAHVLIHVSIQPATGRDRRRREVIDYAQHLLASLKAYFMAQQTEQPTTLPDDFGFTPNQDPFWAKFFHRR